MTTHRSPAFGRTIAAIALALAAGCSSVPLLVPDMARHPARAVQLDGTRGALSARQSRDVLARLEARGEETGIFDRHLALEAAITGSPLVVGNRVVLLNDGPAALQAMLDAIAAARDHVHMETYIIEADEVGAKFAAALVAKRAQGVHVSFIHDGVGTIDVPRAFFTHLSDNGVAVLEFNPVNPLARGRGWQVNHRDHRKLLVVDGRIAFVGGVNISSVYSGGSSSRRGAGRRPPWRDTHLQLEGPVVAEFQKLFLETWEKQKGKPLAPRNSFPPPASRGKEVVRAIGSSPDQDHSLIYATLISAIESAETSVNLTNAYFVPDPGLLATLKAAAQRGAEVKLILPGASDSWLVFHAGRSYYAELLAAGVKIYERRGAMLHAKTAVIDGVWSTVGSTNLDWRSFLHNDEVNAVVLGQDFGAQMQAMFDADLAASQLVTQQRWHARPLQDRLKERAARIWEYWL
jgi:cardiolipin synthase